MALTVDERAWANTFEIARAQYEEARSFSKRGVTPCWFDLSFTEQMPFRTAALPAGRALAKAGMKIVQEERDRDGPTDTKPVGQP